MPRPEFPRCVMPVEVIRRVNEEQAHYDKDPEAAEREQKRAKERREEELREEQAREYEEYQRQQEKQSRR